MQRPPYLLLLLLLCPSGLLAQLHDNHWLLGYEFTQPPVVGNKFGLTKLNFYTGSIAIEGPIEDGTDHYLNNASFSDFNGDLIAYTNGLIIMSGMHELMSGGDSLNRTIVATNQELRYKSTDVAIQGCLFLPYPGHPDSVLLFYTGDSYNGNVGTFNQDLSMAIINTTAEGGAGAVVQKEIPIIVEDTISYGNLTAVKHANGRDWWILVQSEKGDYYYPILSDPLGVHVGEKVFHDIVLEYPGGGAGQAIFSPDGTWYAIYGGRSISSGTWLHLFDVDRCKGRLNNRRSIFYPPVPNIIPYGGISFSPNSRFLYHSVIDTLFQYDLQAGDLLATREKVLLRAEQPSGAILRFFQSQLAPDGKIYFCTTNSGTKLNVIHNPDEKGLSCNAQEGGLQIPTINSQTVPNHPNYRLGPLDGSACDTLGLNNFPQAWWRYTQDTLNPVRFDFHDLSYYEPDNWLWDFGDGNTSTVRHPVHTYASTGAHEVCLTVSNSYGSHTHCKTVYSISAAQNPAIQAAVQAGPNPFGAHLTLTLSTPLAGPRLRVYDLTGRIRIDASIAVGVNEFDTRDLAAGVYFWTLSTAQEGIVKSGKLVKAGR